MGLTDLVVVGVLGTDALAAVGLGKTVLLSFLTVGFAIISVGTVLMAEALSPERCGAVLCSSLLVALGAAATAVAIAYTTPMLLKTSNYDENLVDLYFAYTSVLALAAGPAMFLAALKNVLVSHGKTGIIFWMSLGMVMGNLGSSICLVHGVGSWDGLGVAGAAIATLGTNLAAAVALFVVTVRKRLVSFTKRMTRSVFALSREIFAIGWAAGAQQVVDSLMFVAVLYFLGLYSPVWLAAGTVAFAVMELNYASSAALGEVLVARLAAAKARMDRRTIQRLMSIGTAMSGFLAIVVALVVLAFPMSVVSIFSGSDTDASVRLAMANLLTWTAFFFVFDVWQAVFVHALRGLRQTEPPRFCRRLLSSYFKLQCRLFSSFDSTRPLLLGV